MKLTKPPRPERYQQINIRIGRGKAAAEYLARIDAAMLAARRRTRSDWLRFVIDLALEESESATGHTPAVMRGTRDIRTAALRTRTPSLVRSK